MTDDRLALSELAAKSGDSDFLRTIAESVLQLIMEADVDGLIGAGRYERGDGRQTWRNGYRDRSLDTRLGTLNLKIPKMRQGAYFPRLPGAEEDGGEGAGGRDPGGMDQRRLDAQGR
jgi:transposase-like protein